MPKSIGLLSSKLCVDEVQEFLRCQHINGFWGRVVGACNAQREIMDECLDREVHKVKYDSYSLVLS